MNFDICITIWKVNLNNHTFELLCFMVYNNRIQCINTVTYSVDSAESGQQTENFVTASILPESEATNTHVYTYIMGALTNM